MNLIANVITPTGRFCSLFVDFSESPTLKADGSLVAGPFIATQISWKVVSSVGTSRWSDFYCRNTPQLQVQPPFRWAAAPICSSSISDSWESIEAGDVGVLPRFSMVPQTKSEPFLDDFETNFAQSQSFLCSRASPSPVLRNTSGSRRLTHLHTLEKSKEKPLFICFH